MRARTIPARRLSTGDFACVQLIEPVTGFSDHLLDYGDGLFVRGVVEQGAVALQISQQSFAFLRDLGNSRAPFLVSPAPKWAPFDLLGQTGNPRLLIDSLEPVHSTAP